MAIDRRTPLVEALRATGLSQSELARRIRVSQPTVQAWFAGDKLPDVDSTRKIIAPDAFPQFTPLAYDILRPDPLKRAIKEVA